MATLVTAKGREMIVNQLRATGTDPKVIGWGTNPAGRVAAISDVAPFTEATEARVTGTSSVVTTTTTNDTHQVTGTIVVAGAGKTIAEFFLSDSTTQPAVATVAAGGVVGSAVSTTLNTVANFTPGNNSIQIRDEVLTVSAGSGTTALTVARGTNGSTAISTITAGDIVTPGNPPGSTAITGGSVYMHGDFTGFVLNVGESIAFTVKTKFI